MQPAAVIGLSQLNTAVRVLHVLTEQMLQEQLRIFAHFQFESLNLISDNRASPLHRELA